MLFHEEYFTENSPNKNIKHMLITAVLGLVCSLIFITGKEILVKKKQIRESANFEVTVISSNYRHDDCDTDSDTSFDGGQNNNDGGVSDEEDSGDDLQHLEDVKKVPRRFIIGTVNDGGIGKRKKRLNSTCAAFADTSEIAKRSIKVCKVMCRFLAFLQNSSKIC